LTGVDPDAGVVKEKLRAADAIVGASAMARQKEPAPIWSAPCRHRDAGDVRQMSIEPIITVFCRSPRCPASEVVLEPAYRWPVGRRSNNHGWSSWQDADRIGGWKVHRVLLNEAGLE